jgi:hypothetical protein
MLLSSTRLRSQKKLSRFFFGIGPCTGRIVETVTWLYLRQKIYCVRSTNISQPATSLRPLSFSGNYIFIYLC